VPIHNMAVFEDRLIYADTDQNELVSFNRAGGAERRLHIPGAPGFLRGMACSGDTLYIGSQAPAAVYQVDLASWKIKRVYLLDGLESESVYGVALVPWAFADPPAQLDLWA
jgi:hypothetical protein